MTEEQLPRPGDKVEIIGGPFVGRRGVVITNDRALATRQVILAAAQSHEAYFVTLDLFSNEVSVRFPAKLIKLVVSILFFISL